MNETVVIDEILTDARVELSKAVEQQQKTIEQQWQAIMESERGP